MKVLQSAYKSSEHPLGLRKDGLDTRLFTLPHVLRTSQVMGSYSPTGPVKPECPDSANLAF